MKVQRSNQPDASGDGGGDIPSAGRNGWFSSLRCLPRAKRPFGLSSYLGDIETDGKGRGMGSGRYYRFLAILMLFCCRTCTLGISRDFDRTAAAAFDLSSSTSKPHDDPMMIVLRKMQKLSALPASGLATRVAVVAAAMAFSAPASADSWLDSLNPLNLFRGDKYKTEIVPDVPAEDIYNQGLARLQSKDYEAAAKKFTDLEKQYPYSQWQRKGLLMTTFSQYQAGSYDDAIASAKRYIALFPTSSDVAYAYYLEAMSYYNQIPEISRDQDRSAKAAETFSQLIDKFPKSEYADDARYKLQVCRDQLAGKEMLVGRYYLTTHNYGAAINRFREVLFKYQTTRHAEEALLRLTEAYLALGVATEAQTAAAVLGHNFPGSVWYKDAYALLKEGGLEPHEDQGSWISKAFHKMGLG